MAIHSIDNKTEGVQDQIQQIREGLGTTSISPVIEGQSQGYVTTKDAQILVNDGTYNRVAIGQRSDGTYGIKVSGSGYDALTADNANLVMNSDYNQFKIVGSGTGTITAAGKGTFTAVINHNLGYTPAHIAFGNYPGGGANTYYGMPVTALTDMSPAVPAVPAYGIYAQMSTYVTSTALTISLITSGGVTDGAWAYKYYLLQETAN